MFPALRFPPHNVPPAGPTQVKTLRVMVRSYWTIILVYVVRTDTGVSWQEPTKQVDRRALPTAPRASTQPRVEMSRLPSKPPYTAYMGNLSFEVEDFDILEFFKRRNVKVWCNISLCCVLLLYYR